MNDYLFLEPLLIERIQAHVKGLAHVGALVNLEQVNQYGEASPAVYVIYLGDEISDGSAQQGGNRSVQVVTQNWAVVLAINVADATGLAQTARQSAGALLAQLLNALTGFVVAPNVKPLARSTKQSAVVYSQALYYYPLVFETSFIFK